MRSPTHVLLLVSVFDLESHAVWSQPRTSAVRGHVIDPSGRTIPDAIVAFTSRAGKLRNAKSDSQGEYQLRNLDPGTYRISANLAVKCLNAGGSNSIFNPRNWSRIWCSSMMASQT